MLGSDDMHQPAALLLNEVGRALRRRHAACRAPIPRRLRRMRQWPRVCSFGIRADSAYEKLLKGVVLPAHSCTTSTNRADCCKELQCTPWNIRRLAHHSENDHLVCWPRCSSFGGYRDWPATRYALPQIYWFVGCSPRLMISVAICVGFAYAKARRSCR